MWRYLVLGWLVGCAAGLDPQAVRVAGLGVHAACLPAYEAVRVGDTVTYDRVHGVCGPAVLAVDELVDLLERQERGQPIDQAAIEAATRRAFDAAAAVGRLK